MTIPVANAGADQLFPFAGAPFNVPLADAGSFDPDAGTITAWLWTLVYAPPGSAAALINATTSTPTLNTVDIEGSYLVHLQVTDSGAESSAPPALPPTSPSRFDSTDSAFVTVVHKTELLDFRIPAQGERSWADLVFAMWLKVDEIGSAGAGGAEPYLTNGAAPTLSNEVDIQTITTVVKFISNLIGVVPLAAQRSAIGSTADIFQIMDEAGAALAGFRASGELDMKADLRNLRWPNVAIRQNGSDIEFWDLLGAARLALLTGGGDLYLNGNRLNLNEDAVLGVVDNPFTTVKDGDGASLVEWISEYGSVAKRLDAYMLTAGVLETDPVWMFGKSLDSAISNPGVHLSGGDGAAVKDVLFKIDGANNKLFISAPSVQITKIELEIRIVLDVNDDIECDSNIVLDFVAGGDQNIKKTTAGDLYIGTFAGGSAGELVFKTDNVDRWKINGATGVFESIGGPRAIQQVLDPVSAQDAATKAYVDGAVSRPSVKVKVFADTGYVAADKEYILVDATAGATTIALPPVPTTGDRIVVFKTDASVNAVTINRNGNNINGAAVDGALAAQNDTDTYFSDGTDWFVE